MRSECTVTNKGDGESPGSKHRHCTANSDALPRVCSLLRAMATRAWTRTKTTKMIGRSKLLCPPRAHLGRTGAQGPLRSAGSCSGSLSSGARPSCSRPSCSPNSRVWLRYSASRSFTTIWAAHEAQNTQASPSPKSLPVICTTCAVPAGICINSSCVSADVLTLTRAVQLGRRDD